MTALQLMLLIIGVIFFIGSFFITEKLSASDVEQLRKIGEKEIKVMIDKELREGVERLEGTIGERVADASESFERDTDREANEKLMSIDEYANTVLKSMNDTHNQIMFLYDRLSDKEDKLTQLTGELQAGESNLLALKEHIGSMAEQYEVTLAAAEEQSDENLRKQKAEEEMQDLKDAFMAKIREDREPESGGAGEVSDEKEQIIALYKEGYSEVEIAKRMGKGLGEIKLVLGLFDEEYRG